MSLFFITGIACALLAQPATATSDGPRFQMIRADSADPNLSISGATESGLVYGTVYFRENGIEKARAAIYRITTDHKLEKVWTADKRSSLSSLNDDRVGVGFVINAERDVMVPAIFRNGSFEPMTRADGEVRLYAVNSKGTIAGKFVPKSKYEEVSLPELFFRRLPSGVVEYAPEELKGSFAAMTDTDTLIVTRYVEDHNGEAAVGGGPAVENSYESFAWLANGEVLKLGTGEVRDASPDGSMMAGSIEVTLPAQKRGWGHSRTRRIVSEATTWTVKDGIVSMQRSGNLDSFATSINASGTLTGMIGGYTGTPFIMIDGKMTLLTSKNVSGMPVNAKLLYVGEVTDRLTMLGAIEMRRGERSYSYDTVILVPMQ